MLGSSRRSKRPRLVVVGLMLTIAVIAFNAVGSATDNETGRQIDELAYVDELRGDIDISNQQKSVLDKLRSDVATVSRGELNQQIEDAKRVSERLARRAQNREAPESLQSAHALAAATFVVRAEALKQFRSALDATLRGDNNATAELASVGEKLTAADTNYRLFVSLLPKAIRDDAALPESTWIDEPQRWSRDEMGALTQTLRNNQKLTPVHDVAVVVVNTTPAPARAEGTRGSRIVLPIDKTLDVSIVVANVGNEDEARVPISVDLRSGSSTDKAKDGIKLVAGERTTVRFRDLKVDTAAESTLVVQVGPVEGEKSESDNERKLLFIMQ